MGLKLSLPQSRAFYSQAKSTAVVAGFGSGKTTTAVGNVFKLLFRYPGIPQGYAAPTYGDIKTIFYPAVDEFCTENNIRYHIHKSDHVINVHGVGNIVCKSLSNPDMIKGFEVGDFHLDELDLLDTEKARLAWNKCKARCRKKFPKKRLLLIDGRTTEKKKKKNQMFLYTTPEGFKFTYEKFKKEPFKNSRLIQMSTYSNLHNLPDDYIDGLKADYPIQLVQAYIEGQFVNLNSMAVWVGYDRVLNRSFELIRPEDKALIIGMDFNIGRGCAVIYIKRPNGLHAVDEVVNTYETRDTIKIIKSRYPDKHITVVPDASGNKGSALNATASDLALLKQAGFMVKNHNRNPNVKDRVTATNALFHNGLGQRRLFVNDLMCPYFADALEQQAYDKNGVPEKGEGKQDDITDAGTYPVEYYFPIQNKTARLIKATGL